MKFAFTTTAAPEWDVQTRAALAKEHSFDGVELSNLPTDSPNTRAILQAAGIPAGTPPFVPPPTLNSRIQYALIPAAAADPLENFPPRLRGIGYDGYIAVQSAQILPKLREWTKPQAAKPAPKTIKPAIAIK